jgi:hypothetical protein
MGFRTPLGAHGEVAPIWLARAWRRGLSESSALTRPLTSRCIRRAAGVPTAGAEGWGPPFASERQVVRPNREAHSNPRSNLHSLRLSCRLDFASMPGVRGGPLRAYGNRDSSVERPVGWRHRHLGVRSLDRGDSVPSRGAPRLDRPVAVRTTSAPNVASTPDLRGSGNPDHSLRSGWYLDTQSFRDSLALPVAPRPFGASFSSLTKSVAAGRLVAITNADFSHRAIRPA